MDKIDECYDIIIALNKSDENYDIWFSSEKAITPGIKLHRDGGIYSGEVIFFNGSCRLDCWGVATKHPHHISVEAVIDDLHSKLVEAAKVRAERLRSVSDSLAKFTTGR